MKILFQENRLKPSDTKKILTFLLTVLLIIVFLFVGRFLLKKVKKATSVDPALVSELTPRVDTASIKKATQILEEKTSQIPISKPKISSPPSKTDLTQTPPPEKPQEKSLEVQILNGSPKTNAAQEMAQKLESLGYTIKNTSEADRKDYTSTTIRLKSNAEENYEEIKQTLYPTFANFVKERLTDQSTVDIVIVLGQ